MEVGSDIAVDLHIYISGTFDIGTGNLIGFYNCTIELASGTTLKARDYSLFIFSECDVFSCEGLWNEIMAEGDYANVYCIDSNIEDGLTAFHAVDNGSLYLKGNTFDANYVAVKAENSRTDYISHDLIEGNDFLGTTALKENNLNLTEFPYVGVWLSDIGYHVNRDNLYSNLGIGLLAENGYISSTNNDFQNMRMADPHNNKEQGIGVYLDKVKFATVSGGVMDNCPNSGLYSNISSFSNSRTRFSQIGRFAINVEKAGVAHRIERCQFIQPLTSTVEIIHLEKGLKYDWVHNNNFQISTNLNAIVRLNGENNSQGFSSIFQNQFYFSQGRCVIVDGFESSNISIVGYQGPNTSFPPLQNFDQRDANGLNPSVIFHSQGKSHLIRGNYFGHGEQLFLDGANNVFVCGNIMDGHPNGFTQDACVSMHLRGDCSGSGLNANRFRSGFNTGLFLDGNGVMIGRHPFYGNIWEPASYSNAAAFTTGTDFELNQFIVNSDDNPNCFPKQTNTPSGPSVIVPPGMNQTWFIENLGQSNATSCLAVQPLKNTDISLLKGDLDLSFAHYWSAARNLYTKLKDGDINVSPEYSTDVQSFLQTHEFGIIGQVYAINKKIAEASGAQNNQLDSYVNLIEAVEMMEPAISVLYDAIPSDGILPSTLSDEIQDKNHLFQEKLEAMDEIINDLTTVKALKLAEALSLINGIEPIYFHESLLKKVLGFQIKSLKGELTDVDFTELQSIASQEYDMGGYAVLNAKALLPECLKNTEERRFVKGELVNSDEMVLDLDLFPNPSTGVITIFNPDLLEKQITICNIQGNVVRKLTLTDASSKIDLTKEKDGMYFVQISTANTRPKTIRIIKTSL